MTILTVTLDSDAYEAMVTKSAHDFAVVEAALSIGTPPYRHALKLHARALYLRNQVDNQNGIVRADDGEPKPDPHP